MTRARRCFAFEALTERHHPDYSTYGDIPHGSQC